MTTTLTKTTAMPMIVVTMITTPMGYLCPGEGYQEWRLV